MKKLNLWIFCCTFFLVSCSGASSVVKKSWKNTDNTIAIVDMTKRNDSLMDAGAHLHRALEDSLLNTNFIITSDREPSRFKLKYKVVDFDKGSRIKRFTTIGALSKMGQAKLKVQAALFKGKSLVGRWDVESWLNDGLFGGANKTLFHKAATEILEHLKGDY